MRPVFNVLRTACICGAVPLSLGTAFAEDQFDAVRQDIAEWSQHPVTQITLAAQNRANVNITSSEIEELDQLWRAQTEADDQPLIAQLLGSPLSAYLIRKMAEAGGLYREIFIVDEHGLNAGQSAVTSDYWQGDDAEFIDEPEALDDGRVVQQINVTITDPETDEPIGAITVEVNLARLSELSIN